MKTWEECQEQSGYTQLLLEEPEKNTAAHQLWKQELCSKRSHAYDIHTDALCDVFGHIPTWLFSACLRHMHARVTDPDQAYVEMVYLVEFVSDILPHITQQSK